VPEAEHSTTARLPVPVIWDFVREMDNWAHLLRGYQSHEKQSDTDSVWVLKGDVGMLARTVKFHVHIDEWGAPSRVRFTLRGLNEPMSGGGEFLLEPFEDAGAAGAAEAAAPKPGFFARLVARLLRFLYRLRHGRVARAEGARAGPGAGMARLSFRLRVAPGGPMGPMVDALMKPLMLPVAEELADRIMSELERRHGQMPAKP
jgi:carbon monoxide dehydrogenase subunit G